MHELPAVTSPENERRYQRARARWEKRKVRRERALSDRPVKAPDEAQLRDLLALAKELGIS